MSTPKCYTRGKKSKKPKKPEWDPSDFPYETDYNDHFETPLRAYRDIAPLLSALFPSRKPTIYDPYYCDGACLRNLASLGFRDVKNEKRDFYVDLEAGTTPSCDVLVTNPPYSSGHKERCVRFACEKLREDGTPFFLLLPNYAATKSYLRDLLVEKNGDVVYVVPSEPYQYQHPENTGHDQSPFTSLWFCGIGKGRMELVQKAFRENNQNGARLVTSFQELGGMGVVSTKKRMNPKQRRRLRKKLDAAYLPDAPTLDRQEAIIPEKIGKKTKPSKRKRPVQNPKSGKKKRF